MDRTSLQDKVVVITGASSGFGKGAALAFAAEGAAVVAAARRSDALDELACEAEQNGHRIHVVPTDVSRIEDMEALCAEALRERRRIDVWINNAGVGALGPFERIPLADHVQVIETNLMGTLYGSYLAYRQFLHQGHGTVINVASELGRHTVPYYSSYAAAKHGIVGLDESLRQELEANRIEDIHVCTVLPSAHDTPFFDHAANYTGHEVQAPKPLHDPRDVVETLVELARHPKKREYVGADGFVKVVMRNLMPDVANSIMAKQVQKMQIDDAPPAPHSPGAVRVPIDAGTDVRAGRAE